MDRKVFILKIGIDNLVVSIAMTLTASIISTVWDIYTIICIPFTFILSFIVSYFVPVGKIINWFSGLFKIKPNTFLADVVGNLFTNIFFTTLASLSCKLLIFKDFEVAFGVFVDTFIIMYCVSYLVYLGISYLSSYLIKKHCEKKTS